MPDRIFPQDSGTGLHDQDLSDYLDSASLGALGHAPNAAPVVVDGLGFTPDYQNDELTVAAGQARLVATDVAERDRGDPVTWPAATFPTRATERTVSLSPDAYHDVFLVATLSGSPDDVSIDTRTDGSTPSDPSVKIGTVDTGTEESDDTLNRAPDATVADLTVEGAASGVASDSHASTHEAGGGDELTIGSLAGFDPADILVDTETNRPSAGTTDRVFIETDTGTIYRDTGSAWDVMGTTNISDTDHSATDHESGGGLEIDVTDLTGDLADPQDPKGHASTHAEGNSDALSAGSLAGFDPADILVDTETNRPSAGTTDRVFIETDTGTIYRDTGSAWDVMGTTNISDTDHSATDHESGGKFEIVHNNLSGGTTRDAHHIRPSAGTALAEDGSNNFNVQEGDITHDNLSGGTTSDAHHIRPGAGDYLYESGDDFNVDHAAALIDSPNGHIGTADLPASESAELTVRLADGEAIFIYAWGGYTVPSGTAPSGLQVQLIDPSGTTQASENTVWTANASGVASYTNSSGGVQIMRLRVDNSTGTNYTSDAGNDGVAAQFAYEVV
jgi:DNA replication initiation complex subunit (GINS family)